MSGSLLTDFNDLHQQSGLQALRSLLLDAVADTAAFPAPLSHGADQNKGAISRSEIVVGAAGEDLTLVSSKPWHGKEEIWVEYDPEEPLDDRTTEPTEEKSYVLNLDRCLGRFALLEGTTKVWDAHRKKLMTKAAFNELVTLTLANEWRSNVGRRLIDEDAVKTATASVAATGETGELVKRFVMLEGTLESWDCNRRQRIRNATIKENFAAHYDIWLKSPEKRMVWHEHLVFDPTQKCPVGHINMFDGLPIKPIEDKTRAELLAMCQGIHDLLFELCEADQVIFDFVIRWLALPLQHQGTKMDSALLFHGPVQGAGKSLFFDKIMRKIYGRFSAKLGQGQLDANYDDWKSQNLYTVFEEILSPADRYGAMGKVKDLVTADTTRIEKKFVSGWEESSHINFVFNSNEHQPLPLEKQDRRFLVAWPRRKLPEEIRVRAGEELQKPECIAAWFSYLLSVDTTGFTSQTNPPMTEAKARIIRYGQHGWQSFYDQWKAGDTAYPYVSCRTRQLYNAYKHWCAGSGEKSLPENKFLELICAPDESRPNFEKKRCYYSTLTGTKLQSWCVIVGVKNPDMTQEQWLGDCIDQWDQLKSVQKGDNDVPPFI